LALAFVDLGAQVERSFPARPDFFEDEAMEHFSS
jgi:hypothetical protein